MGSNGRPSILIVDDDRALARACAFHFNHAGWKARMVFSGDHAVQALKHFRDFQVILLDMRMPGKDGFATLKEIRDICPQCCVVFFTGYGDMDSAVQAVNEGAASMVLKGAKSENLLLQVSNIHRQHQERLERQRDKEEALRLVATLAFGMAHQIKNRLAAAGSALFMLHAAGAKYEAFSGLEQLFERLQQTLDLAELAVSRLLRFGHLKELNPRAVKIDLALAEAENIARRRHQDQGYAAKIDIQHSVPKDIRVLADANFLPEVLECVLDNAIEATRDRPHPRIIVRAERLEELVEVTIADNGPGFSDDWLKHGPRPFRTAKTGTNIGFALVFAREFVRRSGGDIQFDNLSNGGARVTLQLPEAKVMTEPR
jgi:signal transduction histidine kinase